MKEWKKEAERLKFDEGMSWSEVAKQMEKYFPELDGRQVFEKVRMALRRSDRYGAFNSDPQFKHTIQYNKDGTVEYDRLIEICEGQEMTPEVMLEAHGLDKNRWQIISYRNNYWHSQVRGGKRLVMYQSKITVKPIDKPFNIEAISKHFEELDRKYKPPLILPEKQEGNLIASVEIADLHIGKLCWHGDTGNNYDYKIARNIYHQIICDVYHELKGKPIEYIFFPVGNDLVNSDTPDKTTTAGTPQDTDVRWQKLIDVTTEMVINGIEILKQIAPVKVSYIASNHDEVTTYGIVNTLGAWFRQDPRVEVDKSPISRKYFLFGKTLVCYAHGNTEKPLDGTKNKLSKMAALMPVEAKQLWAQADYAEIHAAHFHSERSTDEVNGIITRRISSPTAADTWTFKSGYIGAVRKAQTFLYDKEIGLIQIINTPVRR